MTKEAIKLAIEWIEKQQDEITASKNDVDTRYAVLKELEAALTQEQDEPVTWESVLGAVARGWCYEENANKTMDSELAVAIAKEVHALYTTPQQRTWVGLTRDEIQDLLDIVDHYNYPQDLIVYTQAKLKEKNNG
jgi:hypothetical protein